MLAQQIVVEDQTTQGSLSPEALFKLAWALNYQALYHYGRSPWVQRGYAPPSHVHLLPKGVPIPGGAWPIILLDNSDVAEALGYHDNQLFKSSDHAVRGLAPGGTPFSKVFVHTAQGAGIDPAEVASHEMLEMLVDPYVSNEATVRKVLNRPKKEFYIVEVGDPVQGNGYDVGAPDGHHCGVTVADFAWPRWWGMAQTRAAMSFREAVKNAFEIGAQGYMSVAPETEPTNWSQIYGQMTPHEPNPQ